MNYCLVWTERRLRPYQNWSGQERETSPLSKELSLWTQEKGIHFSLGPLQEFASFKKALHPFSAKLSLITRWGGLCKEVKMAWYCIQAMGVGILLFLVNSVSEVTKFYVCFKSYRCLETILKHHSQVETRRSWSEDAADESFHYSLGRFFN